jgi:RNA binding exosome subunit
MEVLLYHTHGNERVDEFLETFLSMHVDKEVAVRRFTAYFIEVLCFTRSRYACSCLEVLVTLLQDQDKQVNVFALRATRIVYKRALYYISLQQKETRYVQAARESVQALDHVLARVVHHITAGSREVFCEAIRCAQSVVLSQSFSSFAPKSLSQLELSGCSCLEDLRLVDTTVLDEMKLKAQADKLFTAFCALLIKQRPENMEIVALIHAVGVIGHDRSSYAGAATVAFAQLAQSNDNLTKNTRVKNALVSELKRILASRHCIQWQPKIIPVLSSLGISTQSSSATGLSTDLVMEAELDRMRESMSTEMGNEPSHTTERDGERSLAVSEIADGFKVPDEENAIAICSVRAQSPAELAKLAIAMLSRLPKNFDDPSMALVKINRAGALSVGNSIGFENRVKAIKSVGIGVKNFVDTTTASDDEMDIMEDNGVDKPALTRKHPRSHTRHDLDTSVLLDNIIQTDRKIFSKILVQLSSGNEEMVTTFINKQLSASITEGVIELSTMVYRNEILGLSVGGVGFELLGQILSKVAKNLQTDFSLIRTIINGIPMIPQAVLEYIDVLIETTDDVVVRRNALTVLANFALTKPGLALDSIGRILNHCSSRDEGIRTDSLKLVIARLYKPSSVGILKWQWPYKDTCPMKKVESLSDFCESKLEVLCSEQIEVMAMERFEQGSQSGSWDMIWPMLALCSKKLILIHYIASTLIERDGDGIPTEYIQSFGTSLAALPGDIVDKELEIIVKEYKGVRSVSKKKNRNDFILPILSCISGTSRGLTNKLADAALSFNK